MKIAYEHILKFLPDKPDINDLSSRLFQLGHEHEIEDSIFDIEFTPNRGDCLSVKGISRDLNVFYKTNLDLAIYNKDINSLDLNFINLAPNECPYISFLNIEIGSEVSEYKDYLENYFKDFKLNKNNFFTDISNYIAYEMGQPTHCYDFTAIGKDITLKNCKNSNLKFTSLLGNDVILSGTNLTFFSEEKIINLAGIMGDIKTACKEGTKNALIECGYFRPESVIGKATKYNLHSDASYKFERGTDPECHELALRRFIQIVSEHAEIMKLEIYSENNDFKDIELDYDLEKVNKILGTNETDEKYKKLLIKLGFDVSKTIKVPSFRSDINHQNDLAEELARLIGYNNIPSTAINLKPSKMDLDSSSEDSLKEFLVRHGFTEVINSSFCQNDNLGSIKVDNPLDSSREFLRTNLTDSLIENLIYNERRQKDSIKLFEISDVYTSTSLANHKQLAIIISGRRGENHRDFSKKLDKKYLIEMFKEKDFDIDKYITSIDREILNSKIKSPIFCIELSIDTLIDYFDETKIINKSFSNFIKYKPISDFPSSYRDFSFSIKDNSKIDEVISILSCANSDIIKNSFMFDFYQNTKLKETKIGFRFIFQSKNKTLTDDEIDNEIKNIINPVLMIKSVSMPGSI